MLPKRADGAALYAGVHDRDRDGETDQPQRGHRSVHYVRGCTVDIGHLTPFNHSARSLGSMTFEKYLDGIDDPGERVRELAMTVASGDSRAIRRIARREFPDY